MNPAVEDSISPMAPILRRKLMAPIWLLGLPLHIKDVRCTSAKPKTGFGYFLVFIGALLPVLTGAFVGAYPMVADLPFYIWFFGVLPKFHFTFLDQFGAILMLSPLYVGGLLSLYLWSRKLCDRLTEFLELFCQKLGSLVSPGMKLKCGFP